MVTLLAIIAIAGALAPASGQAPVRYRDVVFDAVDATTNIPYATAERYNDEVQTLQLDLFEPRGDTERFRPVFIWAHGGFFTSGHKGQIGSIRDFMVRRGWVTISVQYRLNPTLPQGLDGYIQSGDPSGPFRARDAIWAGQNDLQAAVRWVRANAARYRLDAGRIGIGGFSAGATSSVAVAWNGNNPETNAAEGFPSNHSNPGYPSRVQAALGAGTGNAPGFDTFIDPLVEVPVAMFMGTQDELTTVAAANCAIATALLDVCEFNAYPGVGHTSTAGLADWPDFLYRYVIEPPRTPTTLVLQPSPASAQLTDALEVAATLTADGAPVAGRRLTFTVGPQHVDSTTGPDGVARATITPSTEGATEVTATYSGEETVGSSITGLGTGYSGSSDARAINVVRETTLLTYEGPTQARGETVEVAVRLVEDDGPPVAGAQVTFAIAGRTATTLTDATGLASAVMTVPDHGRSQRATATYAGDATYGAAEASATVTWGNGAP